MTPAGPGGGSPVRNFLAECRIRSESFVAEMRGGRRGRRDKEQWDDAVPDLVR